MIKRVISLLLALFCITCAAATCFYAVGENEGDNNVIDNTEPTEEPTQAPTQPPTDPPKPSFERLGMSAYIKTLEKTVYDNDDLGATYTKDFTRFKLWTPAADDVKVCIYKTGSDEEEGFNTITVQPMNYSKKTGTWFIALSGDYKNMYYTYKVTIGDDTYEVVDPYAKAVGVNGNRGMIVDLNDTDPEGWDNDKFSRVDFASNAVVWEVSVRDFSASETSGVSEANRGKFLAFTEEGTTLNGEEGGLSTCVSYLKELGVNYVQINPFYDFASIDESKSLDDQYNWGYDPKNYNVPEGSYSSNPYDGRVRVKECKQMIQALHKAGIGVIMDVVYNHTYFSEDSFFNRIAPNYYHRVDEDGTWSNGSGCGNDVASERFMVRKFIRESVKYWAQEYHIDGFRFDLMGLTDVDTMNGIRTDLDSLPNGKRIIMYGEAWNMQTSVGPEVKLATQDNMYLLSGRIGAFNDTGRDAIKGSNFNASEKGFVQSGKSKSGVKSAVDGDGSGWAQYPNQCVNYASCHDNLTLYDKLTASVYGDDKYSQRRDNLVAMNKLSAAIVLMSRGMPFMLAGEELGRTKQGDENSYQSSLEINEINWKQRFQYASMTDYYKGLIKIRKAVPALRDAYGNSEITYLETDDKTTLAYTVKGSGSPSLVVGFNGNTDNTTKLNLPDGEWEIVGAAERAGLSSMGTVTKSITIQPSSAIILMDKASFAKVEEKGPESIVYLRYRDMTENAIVGETRLEGKEGDKYEVEAPEDILFNYNILNLSALKGTFTKGLSSVEIRLEAYNGGFSTVTIKFLNDKDEQIADTIIMTNRTGQQYFTPSIPGITGYKLDTDKLPDNGAGKYIDGEIEVVYRYLPITDEEKEGGLCRANVIYMADDGTVLEHFFYNGAIGEEVSLDKLEFEGYHFNEASNPNAVFDVIETNVIMSYRAVKPDYLKYVLIAGGAILLIGLIALAFNLSKRRKMKAIEIEEPDEPQS